MSPSHRCLSASKCIFSRGGMTGNRGPQHVSICLKRRRKSVLFSHTVDVRCFFIDGISLSWMGRDEVENNKRRAKDLSKLYLRLRWKKARAAGAAFAPSDVNVDVVGDAARYEIAGESLRGMERITDHADGLRRRRAQEEAVRAAVIEQGERLSPNLYHDCDPNETNANASAGLNMPESAEKLAKSYGDRSSEALAYACRVAQEDAAVAAEILAEDLRENPCSSMSGYNSIKLTTKTCSHPIFPRRVTDELIAPMSPKKLRVHQS